jgi:hypothetical protein
VTPFGEIVAVPERGSVMGNRGRLHDEQGRIRRPWLVTRCRLEFNGRRQMVMAPDRYTELFFLDEATGLAAGHRLCFECRRLSYNHYADAWASMDPGVIRKGRPTAGSLRRSMYLSMASINRPRWKISSLTSGVTTAGLSHLVHTRMALTEP